MQRHALLFALCSITAPALAVEPPITLREFSRTTPDGPAHVFVARVELADPRVEIVVTDPLPGTPAADGELVTEVEATLTATDVWAAKIGAALAVNANCFTRTGVGSDSDVVGLSVSDGRVISPLRFFEHSPDPVLAFAKDRTARIELIGEKELPGVWDAVAGVGVPTEGRGPAGLLVQDGKNLGGAARVEPLVRHPRTGAGVSKDGRVLWLIVVDGHQDGYSVGMTLPELGDLFIELGADDALNLDGDGSSSFLAKTTGDVWLTNKPSDGAFRPVANQLGVRVSPEALPARPTAEAAPSVPTP